MGVLAWPLGALANNWCSDDDCCSRFCPADLPYCWDYNGPCYEEQCNPWIMQTTPCTSSDPNCASIQCNGAVEGVPVQAEVSVELCSGPVTLTINGYILGEQIKHTFNTGQTSFKFGQVVLELDMTASAQDGSNQLSIDLRASTPDGDISLWKA